MPLPDMCDWYMKFQIHTHSRVEKACYRCGRIAQTLHTGHGQDKSESKISVPENGPRGLLHARDLAARQTGKR